MFAIENRYQRLQERVELACLEKDEEISDALRKYCTVLICGFVERSVEVIILDRLRSRAHPRILSFVKSYFKRGRNYDCNTICSLLERFDTSWKASFDEFLVRHEREVEALSSVYSVRNSVAHGGDSGISSQNLRQRCADAKTIVDGIVDATKY